MAESVALNHVVIDQSHHVYRVSGEEIVVGFVTVNITAEEAAVKNILANVTTEESSQNTVKRIMENVLLMNSDVSFIAVFQPNSKYQNIPILSFAFYFIDCLFLL